MPTSHNISPPPLMNIGDLNSQEKGSAARANAGKPIWSYMPLRQVAQLMRRLERKSPSPVRLRNLTHVLGRFQSYGTEAEAINCLELGVRYLMQEEEQDLNQALCAVIRVWELGEKKYKRFNWMKGMPWSECINSAQRHVMAMYAGEVRDNDSNEHHAAHFICNTIMMVHFVCYYPEGNDLPIEWFKENDNGSRE